MVSNKEQIYRERVMRERLEKIMRQIPIASLKMALLDYEAAGGHNHGRGPIPVDGPCGYGKDCWVRRAREIIAAYEGAFPGSVERDRWGFQVKP